MIKVTTGVKIMKINLRSISGTLLAFLFFGLLIAASLPVDPAEARHYGSTRYSSRYSSGNRYYGWNTYGEVQKQQLQSQEEAAREKGREKRRDEIAQETAQAEGEFLDYREAVRETSGAAMSAPRGHYFRRVGHSSSTIPGDHTVVEVGGRTFYYYQGVYYIKPGTKYVVVPAPVGAVVEEPPVGSMVGEFEGKTYYYYFGSFYVKNDKGAEVVLPPVGMVVPYLPDGYQTSKQDEEVYYSWGEVQYKPYYIYGELLYEVVKA